jgi:hypothetical protein
MLHPWSLAAQIVRGWRELRPRVAPARRTRPVAGFLKNAAATVSLWTAVESRRTQPSGLRLNPLGGARVVPLRSAASGRARRRGPRAALPQLKEGQPGSLVARGSAVQVDAVTRHARAGNRGEAVGHDAIRGSVHSGRREIMGG